MAPIDLPELRLALFGANGCGKTTLLASFFGNQQRNAFEACHHYRLAAEDTTDSNKLLSHYYRMEQGSFPASTHTFAEYRFAVRVRGLQPPAMRIVLYDYPGGWWTTTQDYDLADRQKAFATLLTSHVGVLLIDGCQYLSEGAAYVRYLLDCFRNEIARLLDTVHSEQTAGRQLPQQWILGISKADVLPTQWTAESVLRHIVAEASDQLGGLAKTIQSNIFGDQLLLLSAVKGNGSTVIDASSYIGLPLLAPLALVAVLDELAQRSHRHYYGTFRTVLDRLRSMTAILDMLDNALPPKYQVLTTLLKALQLKDGLGKGVEYFRDKQEKAARRGQSLEAAAAAMRAELESAATQKVYYKRED